MRARHVVVVAALFALAGCGSSEVPAAPAPTADAGRSAYVAALGDINGDLVENERAAVNSGENICLDIEQGKTAAEVEKNTMARFEVNADWAKRIVAATKQHLCSAG